MISVIIPIYNIAEYLPACLDSLLKQDNDDFEVIMVNDGSNDSSENVCRKYEQKDSRFRLLNKPNGGVSSARNLGLQHAQGEWIVFVDGDDVVDKQYLTLPDELSDIDAIEKSYYIKSQDEVLLSNVIDIDSLIDSNSKLLKYYSVYIQSNSATLCNKIIRSNIIGNQKFDETKSMGEDFLFFLSIISRINNYYRMKQGAYFYLRRDASASKTVEADRIEGIRISFDNLKSVKAITRSNGIEELGVNLIYARYMPSLLYLHKYLSAKDWFRLFILWISYPWVKKSLMTKFQQHSTLVEFPKAVINRFCSKKGE